MKKAFSIIEVIISLAIFSVILIVMYKTLDMTKYSNKFLSQKIVAVNNLVDIKRILAEDIAESIGKLTIKTSKNKNSSVTFTTRNSYHFKSSVNVNYFLSENNNLIRVETTINNTVKKVTRDILMSDVEKFFLVKTQTNTLDSYLLTIKKVDSNTFLFFNALSMNR